MKIQESAENYLEAILVLKERLGVVRAIDIVNEMHYTKASVSVAMKKLRESGHIDTDKSGFITLSTLGLATANTVYERHKLLTEFLICLGVDAKIAAQDACKIEHDISVQTFEKIKQHAQAHRGINCK